MSDQIDVTTEASAQPDELSLLKSRATLIGLTFHPSIGIKKLKANIEEHLNPTEKKVKSLPKVKIVPENTNLNVAPAEARLKTTMSKRQEEMFTLDQARRAANKLVRVRVVNMNTLKKEHTGEIFTVSNSVVGTIKKFVPFNADSGWHVPQMILNVMQERMCQIFYTVKDDRGRPIKKGKLIKEFAIEILPPLTPSEIDDLAKQQALAQNID